MCKISDEEPKITPSTSKEEDAIKKEEKKGIKGWIGSLKKKKSPVVEAEEVKKNYGRNF